ncbi:MAG: hypothetical protein WCK96_12250 [Methylococcales bacterium]
MRIAINPKLPASFYDTPHNQRSKTELKRWWNNPFIISYETFKRYSLWCLDNVELNGPTYYASYDTVNEAIEEAKTRCVLWGIT